jgi:phosphatidylserine/phosphatidylglycerophosphate/cardiolipin synthase-like enzyme
MKFVKFAKYSLCVVVGFVGLNFIEVQGQNQQALAVELGSNSALISLMGASSSSSITSKVENAFSPGVDAEALVLKVIASAKSTIRLAAYSFTSPKVVQALLHAKKRGVDVRVVVDDRGNRSKASVSAMNILLGASIPVRTNSKYAIHHDKYVIVDEIHVQTGSFNYSKAAAKSNSENVLVVWSNADLAYSYLKHWRHRYEHGRVVHLAY